MNKRNNCLGLHLPSFKHCNSEGALDFEDLKKNLFIFFHFVTVNLEFLPVDWEKRYYFQLGI